MRAFATLLSQIEQTNSTNEKVDLMAAFFRDCAPDSAAWALYFLSGRRPKKFIGSKKLREWAEELARVPDWLSDDCYAAVGDSAEMIALIVAPFKKNDVDSVSESTDVPLPEWMLDRLGPLKEADESEQKTKIQDWWQTLSTRETFVLNKLMTGSLRIGVSETLVYRAISQVFEIPRPTVAARLLGNWHPSAEFFTQATRPPEADEKGNVVDETLTEALPVPFCLAAPLDGPASDLGSITDWQIEWKWDGIRAQIVKAGLKVEIWSRGEERITESFPDLVSLFTKFEGDFTLDGEILAGSVDQPTSFNDLQKRLNRKNPAANFLSDNPISFTAYDLLRLRGESLLNLPLAERRARLENFVADHSEGKFGISRVLDLKDWVDASRLQSTARSVNAEGLMIKRRDAIYATGRKRGIWFKWKVDPLTLDVVLTAAQPGTGRRASLYTDYTFSIWKGETLVPIAKAYSGLSDEEIRELDQWIRRHTLDRFGPVRTLEPSRVFEIGFEGVAASSRHKSGFAVRFPRILRERTDKAATEADRIENVESLLSSLTTLRPNSLAPTGVSSAQTEFKLEPT